MAAEQPFHEDMQRKSEWFYETRGRLSRKDLSRKLHGALDQISILRENRSVDLDEAGTPPDGAVALVGASDQAAAAEVPNPYGSASENFVTVAAQVTGVQPADGAILRLRPRRGSASRVALETAALFYFNDKTRQWNLVERSGYKRDGRYIWGLAHRDGIYAAIALPSDARSLALERFAYHYVTAGVRSGDFARASDYFDRQKFRRVAVDVDELDPDQATDKRTINELVKLHAQTRVFKQEWRGQLPNGGLPEWHLIEHHLAVRPEVLTSVGLQDIIVAAPLIFNLANRVGRWYPLGPTNINGRIKSLAIHPTNSSILYAGAGNGGIWKTTNGGESWRSLWKFQDTMAVGSVAISKSSPQTLYAATGEDTTGWGINYPGVGIYKSTDGGATWVIKGTAADVGDECSKIVVHPTAPKTVYVASRTGVHKTTDGGDHWTRVRAGHATDVVMAHDHPDTLYAGIHNDGVYKTVDGGAHWNRIQSDVIIQVLMLETTQPFPTGASAGWIKLALGVGGPAGSNLVVAKLGMNSGTVLSSSDGGASWRYVGVSEGAEYDEWTSMVAINPRDPKRIHVASVWMQHTTNGWQFQHATGTHADHQQMVYDPNNANVCWVACDGGVYKSTDFGATWTLKSTGLQATQLLSLGVAQTGTFVVGSATQDQGVIQSEGTTEWQDWGGGNEWGIFVVDPNNSDNIYISPGDGRLRRSTDRGRTYSIPTTGLTDWWKSQNRQTKPASFADIAVQPGNSSLLIGGAVVHEEIKDAAGNVTASYGPERRLYHSFNRGASWASSFILPAEPTRVAFAHNGQRAYAATKDGHFYRSDACGTAEWVEAASASNRPPAGHISCITVDPDEPDVVYITYGNRNPHVLRSVDGGAHWTSASGTFPATSLPDIAVSSLVVDPENDDVLYVATDIGVFRSGDGGATWIFYNDSFGEFDLPKVAITALAHRRSENRLFAASLGRGLYFTYTSGIPRLRVLAISYWSGGRLRPGIQRLRVTDEIDTWEMTRAEVIRRIEAGTNVYTRGADGSRGEVQAMPPDERFPIWYLKTAPDATKANNLWSMPEF